MSKERAFEPSSVNLSEAKFTRKRQGGVGRRKTIALLLDYMGFFSGSYEAEIRDAFDRRCRQLDLNLVMFFGGAIDETSPTLAARNSVFELAAAEEVDGVVVCSTVLAARCGVQGMSQFLSHFASVPLCSLGLTLPGVPSVVVDNEGGMARVMEHMICEHGRRRIMFMQGTPGNVEAELRFQAYRRVLAQHNIAFDPELVVCANFMRDQGMVVTEELLARGVQFDAVVAANDSMALGAIAVLRKQGYGIPQDVLVAGFDDLKLARLGNPPLTTVAQPFDAMAEAAIALLLDPEAAQHSACTKLVGEFMPRQSCGCEARRSRDAGAPNGEATLDASVYLSTSLPSIRPPLANKLGSEFKSPLAAAELLLRELKSELEGCAGSFLRGVETLIDETDDDSYQGVENAVAYLRDVFLGFASPELDELWHRARDRIAFAGRAGQVRRRLELDSSYMSLLTAAQQISAAVDLPSLQYALLANLPAAGITNAIVSRHPEGVPEAIEPFVWLRDGEPQNPQVQLLGKVSALGPLSQRRHTALVFPLTSEAQRFGVAVFEYTREAKGHQMLGEQIGAALRSVWLLQEVTQKTMLHERSVQERLATATRMQSLSVLAGGVAHDLNNVLGPLVALPDVISRELEQFDGSEEAISSLRADMESMTTAAQRAAQTIKDLLTLSRQGKITKEPVDLNATVARHLESEASRFLMEGHLQVRVEAKLASQPLVIQASESHLTRAVENLVRNAVEAISAHGEVLVRTFVVKVTEPLAGFETIEPGEYAAVSVTDNGSGIKSNDLARVFEPFFSKKRVKDQSGSGLGLAIVHGVVKEHDGFVDVQSRAGCTAFTLYFPLIEASPVVLEQKMTPVPGMARILIVDDEPVQLRTGRRVLRHLGYEVDTLVSGKQACDVFKQAAACGKNPYDLVILDMILNEHEDGLQVLEHIHQLFPELPAILASGHAPTERAELAVTKGLTWLVKPYTMDVLARTVSTVLPCAESPQRAQRVSQP